MRMNEFMLTHFIQKAENETLEHCYTPMVQQCGGGEDVTGDDGEELCQEYYETSCVTRYGDNTNKAVTECRKVTEPLVRNVLLRLKTHLLQIPVTLCGDRSCVPVPGERQCHDKVSSKSGSD